LNAWTNLHETWYVYHGIWAHLNGVLHESCSSVCVSVCLCLHIVFRQRLGTHVSAATTNFCRRRFLCCPCRIKGKFASCFKISKVDYTPSATDTVNIQATYTTLNWSRAITHEDPTCAMPTVILNVIVTSTWWEGLVLPMIPRAMPVGA
jgi:hypothetical protein